MSEDVKAVHAVHAIYDELDGLPVDGSGAYQAFERLSSAIQKADDAVNALTARAKTAEAARDAALAREARLREAAVGAAAALAASISLLERGGKTAAPSDRIFGIMLDDYRKALEAARAALATPAPDLAAIRREAAERMRERAANVALNACLVDPDGGSPTEAERLVCEEAWRRIMALPLEGEG